MWILTRADASCKRQAEEDGGRDDDLHVDVTTKMCGIMSDSTLAIPELGEYSTFEQH